MKNSTTLWEEHTRDELCSISGGAKSISRRTLATVANETRLDQTFARYTQNLAELSQTLLKSRGLLRLISYKTLDVEVALSPDYLENFLNADDFANSLKYSGTDFRLELKPPIKVITQKDPRSQCDIFGADQLGVQAPAVLELFEPPQQFHLTVHFAIGFNFSGDVGKFYVAHDAHLRNTDGIDILIVSLLAKTINQQLRAELERRKFPPMESAKLPLKNLKIEPLAAGVNEHLSVFSRITAKEGEPAVLPHAPASPIGGFEGWEHVIVKVAPFFVYTFMKDKLQDFIDNYPAQGGIKFSFKVDKVIGTTVPVPDPADPKKRALQITTVAYCNDEFGYRQEFGNVVVTGTLERAAKQGGLDLILRPTVETQPSQGSLIPHVAQQADPVVIVSIPGAIELKSQVEDDGVSILIRYDLKQTPRNKISVMMVGK